jgi:hypothetical protein
MRRLSIIKITGVLLFVFIFQIKCQAQVGCRVGNYIYVTPTGGYFGNNPSDRFPIYSNVGQIAKRNGAQDSQCGILRSKADSYPIVAAVPSNPNSNCALSTNLGDYGKLIIYNTSDNNCAPVNVPLDNYTPILLVLFGGIGAYFLRLRSSHSIS